MADALRAAVIPAPPNDLAERTVARLRAHRRGVQYRRWLVLVPVPLAAAAIALVLLMPTGGAPHAAPIGPDLARKDTPQPAVADPATNDRPVAPAVDQVLQPVAASTVFQVGVRTYGSEATAIGQDIRGLGGFLAGFLPRPAGVERTFTAGGAGRDR
ncbi:hypothetical protein LBMAG53_29300 [Planctomycetota bacterium]|nr:hypothetical protein LBMAG53_29300 [Planctomycetota bacterium]